MVDSGFEDAGFIDVLYQTPNFARAAGPTRLAGGDHVDDHLARRSDGIRQVAVLQDLRPAKLLYGRQFRRLLRARRERPVAAAPPNSAMNSRRCITSFPLRVPHRQPTTG
jgi:hypothetical protein